MSLYLHTRQYAQAVQVRHHFLTLRPQLRSTWLGLVVAHHLNGDIPAALEVYDGLQSCQSKEGGTPPEKAQTYLYIIKMCIEQGEHEDALRRLEAGIEKKIISPRGEVTQLKGRWSAVLQVSSGVVNRADIISRDPAQAGTNGRCPGLVP